MMHRYDIDTDRCICGGIIVYFEDEEPPGEGCEVEGKPWPGALSSQIDMEEEYGDEEHDAVPEPPAAGYDDWEHYYDAL